MTQFDFIAIIFKLRTVIPIVHIEENLKLFTSQINKMFLIQKFQSISIFLYLFFKMMMMIKYHNDTTTFYVAVLEVVQMA